PLSWENDHPSPKAPVPVRNTRAIKPALVAKFLDRKRQQLLINLEAKINLPPLNVFLRQMLGVIASSEVFSGTGSGKPAIVGDSLHEAWHPGATRLEKCNTQIGVAIGDALRNNPLERKLNRDPKGNGGLVVMCVVDVAQRAKAVTRVDCYRKANLICRRPDRLHRRLVNSYIYGHCEGPQ